MPQFVMPGKESPKFQELSDFTQGYIEAMFFTECNCDNEELQDKAFSDLAPEALTSIIEDCAGFEMLNKAILDKCGDATQNGHDFWFTRNHHGVGFWDRGYGEPGDQATEAAHKYKEVYLYAGDDGKVYHE